MHVLARSVRPMPKAIVATLLAFAAAQALPAQAQNLTLTVPHRGVGTQSASTAIEFQADTIAANATVTISGTPLNVPASNCNVAMNCDVLALTAANDTVLLTRIAGTTRVRMQITYTSLPGAPNYCTIATPLAGFSIPVALSGFTFGAPGSTVHGYRITSYMAPPAPVCNIPYLRVPTSRPFLSAAGGLTRLGRLPLNIVLVLDKSGSMAWNVPNSADVRWNRMRSSAELFATVWDAVGAAPPPATISSEGHADDRLGLVFFSSSAADSPLDGANFFKQRAANAAPWLAPVTAAIGANGPGGSTSIGAGIVRARTQLDTVDALTGDTAVVLFTDGEQNTAPCVIRETETIVSGCDVAQPGAPAQQLLQIDGTALASNLLPRGPVYTIALGEAGVARSAQLLEEITQETAGRASYPNNGIAMDTSFVDSLVDHLKGGTVTLVDRHAGSLPSGSSSAPLPFLFDRSLTRVVFVLSWEGAERSGRLELIGPGGAVVTPRTTSTGANYLVAMADIPGSAGAGNWRAVVNARGQDPLVYQLSAYGVESRLSAHVTETAQLGTGAPIEITADIGWNNGVLAKLPRGAVKAYIERPGEDIGTLLHAADLPRQTDNRNKDLSALALKLDQLAREAKLWDRIAPRPTGTAIELRHVGGGRYRGVFNDASVGGRYRIVVVFDWKDRRTGAIRRMYAAERQVPVVPGDAETQVKVTRNPDIRGVDILIVPRDRFGNYVGPGFGSDFRIKTDRGEISRVAADPQLKGEYVFSLRGVKIEDDPVVAIYFRGTLLREGPLSKIGG